MDNNNWRPQPQGGAGEPAMESGDWRTQLQPDSRQRIVNKITETLKRHLPFSGQEGLHELKKIAVTFEEKTYSAATSQSDYLRKISLKMLTMKTKSQNPIPNNPNGNRPTEPASLDSTAQTGQANGNDWQEEVYQKIKTMKEMYLPELNEMYQKIATKLQQHDSLPQQPWPEQLDKLKIFKTMLERIITFLQVTKSNILPGFKEKLGLYEKQIINFINTNRPRKPTPAMQQGQLPPSHMQPMQQQQTQPQINQVQSHDNQMNPQMQSMNLQGSVPTMQQGNMTNLQHSSMSSLSGATMAQPNMMNSLQPGSNLDSAQGNALSSLQQVTGSLQQTPLNASQQTNMNNLSSQSGANVLQQNINPLQSSSNLLQHQHLKQQQEQQMLQKQQFQQRQMQQQQQLQQQQQQLHQQQLHQQAKPQLSSQLQTHQMQQLHQMREGMGVKPGVFQQHHSAGQRSAYTHQQLKSGAPFPISSPQLLQSPSPQIPQHSSPQIDQQNILTSLTKAGTPLQSASSPFVVQSPSTPLAPSPMPGDIVFRRIDTKLM